MAKFEKVQNAFQTGNIEDFQCLATYRGAHCTCPLTPGQKDKLKHLLRKQKDDLDLDDIRTIIWELLCEDHQMKERYYETQVEEKWRVEFPLVDFKPRRRPSRRSDLSRSPTPVSRRLSNTATSSSLQRPHLSTSASEPPLQPPAFSQRVGKGRQADEIERPSTPALYTADGSSPMISSSDDIVESVEDDSPSRGRGSHTHLQRSTSTISTQGSHNDGRPAEQGSEGATVMAADNTAPIGQSVSSGPRVEGVSIPAADIFRFGSKTCGVDQLAFDTHVLDLNDHRWGDSSEDVVTEISDTRLMNIFRKADGIVHEKVDESEAQVSADPAGESNAQPKTPDSRMLRSDTKEATLSSADQHRSSLATGRRKSSFEKSPTRSRSPSTPLHTERSKLAFATMKGDASYERPVKENEENVVSLLRKPFAYKNKKQHYNKNGWVYAIRDPELDLVKIGLTTEESPETRLKQLRSSCKLSMDAHLIKDPVRVSVIALKRFEELIHADLAPHRWYYDCNCGLKSGRRLYPTEHHEWYEISDNFAVQTVRIWGDFLQQNPYGVLEERKLHFLQPEWTQRIEARAPVAKDESHDHHESRLSRWKIVFQAKSDAMSDTASTLKSTEMLAYESVDDLKKDEVKNEEQPTVPMESIAPFEALDPLLASQMPLSTNPDIQLDGVHLPGSSTPPPSADNEQDNVKPVALDFAVNASTGDASSQHTFELQGDHPPVQTDRFADSPNAATQPDGVYLKTRNSIGWSSQMTLLQSALVIWLRRERHGLSSRSIYTDMVRFRWPLSSALLLALYAPHVPPVLSVLIWCLFIPFFVAELREWF